MKLRGGDRHRGKPEVTLLGSRCWACSQVVVSWSRWWYEKSQPGKWLVGRTVPPDWKCLIETGKREPPPGGGGGSPVLSA